MKINRAIFLAIALFVAAPEVLLANQDKDFTSNQLIIGDIVFERGSIYKFDGASKDEEDLLPEKNSFYKYNFSPQVSHDGQFIVFVNTDMKHYNLNIINNDGSGRKRLLRDDNGFIYIHSIQWADHGNEVIFDWLPYKNTNRDGGWKAINVQTRVLRDAAPPEKDSSVLWSNNNIYYAEAIPFTNKIEVGTKEGAGKSFACGNHCGPQIYRWSPDNRFVLYCKYCGYEGRGAELHILDIISGESHFVALGKDADWNFQADKFLQGIADLFNNKAYDGDKRQYSIKDLISIGDSQANKLYMKTLRNEVFARHGRVFNSIDLRYIYGSSYWYRYNPEYSDSMLNDIEKQNVQFILDYEKKIGWR